MTKSHRAAVFSFAMATLIVSSNAKAAVTLPANVFIYSENFNDGKLGATTLTGAASPFSPNIGTQAAIPGGTSSTGWDATKFAGNGTGQMPYTVDNGNSGGIYNFGIAGNTECALGTVSSGTNTPTFGVELINNTGSIISSVDLQYIAEWWRGSSAQVDGLTFRYMVGSSGSTNYLTSSSLTAVSALDLPGPPVDALHPNSPLDGNLAANQPASPIMSTITGLNWTPNTSLYLTWRDFDNGGNDGGVGLDNFQLTANPLVGVKPYWDPNGAAAGLGGAGTWDAASLRWNDNSGAGTPGAFDSGVVAIFSGTGGTVTVDAGGITAGNGLQFEANGYTISGGTLTLGSASPITILDPTHTATIGSKISGSSGLTKGGAGTLALTSNSNDFTGSITISAGTLLVSNDSNLGDAANGLVLNGGTLKLATPGNLSLSAARALSGSGGSFDIGAGNTLTLQGPVNMTGTLGLAAAGNITFSQSTPTVGGLSLPGAGTVTVGDGSPGNTLTINNVGGNTITVNNTTGTLAINGSLSLGGTGTGTRFINVPNAGATFQVTGNMTAVARVGYSGPGTFDLQGDNSGIISGLQIGTTGQPGPTVKLYNGNSLGSISIGIVSNFLNSGTLQGVGTTPIVFASAGELLSIGSSNASPLVFTGAPLEFQAPVNLFRPTGTNPVRITVNNNTTFSRGWNTANVTGTPGDTGTLTNTTGGLVVGGTGTLTLSTALGGNFNNLVVPISADGATVNFVGVNPNNSGVANFGGVTGQTTNLQIGATNNGRFNLGAENAFAGAAPTPVPAKVVLGSGGRLGTGAFNQTLGTLAVTGYGSIDVGNSGVNPAVVQFAAGSPDWTGGGVLSINNWNGTVGAGGGLEQIKFGVDATGLSALNLSLVHFAGYNGAVQLATGEIVPTTATTKVLGDFNNDGFRTPADIQPMLKALTDLATFRTTNSLANIDDFLNVADVNLSGQVDNRDIQALLNIFAAAGGGSVAAVPEPATLLLAALAVPPAIALAARRQKRSRANAA